MDGEVVFVVVMVVVFLFLTALLALVIKKLLKKRRARRVQRQSSRTIPVKQRPDELTNIVSRSEPPQPKTKEELEETHRVEGLNQAEKDQFHRELNAFLREGEQPK